MLRPDARSPLAGFGLSDLRPELVARARERDPRPALSDADYLRRAGLAREDLRTGRLVLTLPALMLFGAEPAVRAALPGLRWSLRHRDARGREAREDVHTNLLDALDRLEAFAARHLPEAPALPGRPVDLRERVLREVFLDALLRRDYARPVPAVFGIEPGRVFLDHAAAPAHDALNDALADCFAQPGWPREAAAETPPARWGKAYFGLDPLVFEGARRRWLAPYPPHGPEAMQARPDRPPRRRDLPEPVEAPKAPERPAAARRTLRDLDALLSEPLPAFAAPLADLSPPVRLRVAAEPSRPPAPAEAPKPAPAETAPIKTSVTEPPAAPARMAPPRPEPVRNGLADRAARILVFCGTPRHRSEIQEFAGFQNRDYFRKEILNPLIEQGLLAPTLPDKPNSPKQQYKTVERA